MSNIRFTRDEVILALDVLYFHGNQRLNSKAPEIIELSELLNKLPIHPVKSRGQIFRNPSGVLKQIVAFDSSFRKGNKSVNVGKVFYEVATEYSDQLDMIHDIAQVIKENADVFDEMTFGNNLESESFPEGALLGHLHRIIEKRDSEKFTIGERCMICGINTNEIYNSCSNLMSMHLAVPITKLNARKKYAENDFITVCPNCHAALHQKRPWITIENCDAIIR